MSVADVQKVHIVAHSGLKETFINSLQEEGLLQIEKADFESLGLSTPFTEVTTVEHQLHRSSHALDYLSQWEEKGWAEKLFAQKPQVSSQEREEILRQDFVPLLEQVENLEKEKNDLVSHIRFLEKEEEFLRSLQGLELPLKSVADTDTTEVVMGVMPLASFKELSTETEDEAFWSHIISQGKRSVHLLLVYLKSQREHYRQILKDKNFNPLYFTDTMLDKAGDQGKVTDVIQSLLEEKILKERKLMLLENKGKELVPSREQLMQIHDSLLNEREKRLSSRNLGETTRAIFLEGWIKTVDIPRLETKLMPFSELVQCYFRPPLPEEDPPIILENPRIGKPFEIITKLYGLPRRGTVDPTLYLAPFFFLFVGLTVSEAGYGLLVALSSFLYIKFAKPRGGLRQFLTLMAILGVATVILGTLVGGWFGFPIRKLMILDPLKDPLSSGHLRPGRLVDSSPFSGVVRVDETILLGDPCSGWGRRDRILCLSQSKSDRPFFWWALQPVRYISVSGRYPFLLSAAGPGIGDQCHCHGGEYPLSDCSGHTLGWVAFCCVHFCGGASF